MVLTSVSIKKAIAAIGLTLLSSPFAIAPMLAQRASGTPYCFVVREQLSVFSRPAPGAATADTFNSGDIAYATNNPPRTVIAGGRAFVEVAIYGGNTGWLPRLSNIDGVPLIVDLTTNQCTRPPVFFVPSQGASSQLRSRRMNLPSEVGGGGAEISVVGQDNTTPYCFAVQTPVNLYSRPSFSTSLGDRYAIGDIAYATTNPPTSGRSEGTSFIEVAIYGGNTAWVPRDRPGADVLVLVDLTTNQCDRPGPGAAGHDSSF